MPTESSPKKPEKEARRRIMIRWPNQLDSRTEPWLYRGVAPDLKGNAIVLTPIRMDEEKKELYYHSEEKVVVPLSSIHSYVHDEQPFLIADRPMPK